MNKKTFIISSIILIIIVSIITSLIAISYLPSPLLDPDPSGTVDIGGGLETGNTNVIIGDGTVKVGITDAIVFDNIVRGNTYATTTAPNKDATDRPFLLRNEGTVRVNVELSQSYVGSYGLFISPSSTFKYWVEPAQGGWTNNAGAVVIDNCFANGIDLDGNMIRDCFVAGACLSASKCNVPVEPARSQVLTNFMLEGNGNEASPPSSDEALLHFEIYPHLDEPVFNAVNAPNDYTEGRSTTITVYGTEYTS